MYILSFSLSIFFTVCRNQVIVLKRFIGPVITVNNMSADDDRLANRVLFAKVLGPGRGEPKSYPAHCKPEAKQLS